MVDSKSAIERYVERVQPTDQQMDILIAAYDCIRLMIRKDT